MNRFALVLAALSCIAFSANLSAAEAPVRIAKRSADFSSTDINEAAIKKVKADGYLTGVGKATYCFTIPATGWYELYVAATGWQSELLLDDSSLIYTAFESGVWEPGDEIQKDGTWKPGSQGAKKVLNLQLAAGEHSLTFSRNWHPGLPWMRGFYLQAATSLSGSVRLTPIKDYLVFRQGEAFPAKLLAGKSDKAEAVVLRITNAESGQLVKELRQEIPAGVGNADFSLTFPTDTEGSFDIELLDDAGNHVDRTIQYCVVDTRQPTFPAELKTEPVEIIDATTREPDYSRGSTRVVKSSIGAYRESDELGREGGTAQASWFAYTLNLPEVQADYRLRIEYPDDDRRHVSIVLVERHSHPMPAQGYSSGGVYPLSGKMQTQDFTFTARDRDARVMFFNWNTGQRAAVARITVERLTSGFPSLKYGPEGRLYGMYQEEPMRYLMNFGAEMGTEGANEWPSFRRATERVGQRLNYAGLNLWFPTIGIYGNTLWPSDAVPGYQVGILPPGPATAKEPFRKDVLRLMLLTSEKYGLDFYGDLCLPNVRLDDRFGDDPTTPWITVNREGKPGAHDARQPYYNPLYPGVQDWTASVFRELATRYQDCPAFKGLRIRLMLNWAFEGWQCFQSLDWGYDDYTVGLFTQETGIAVPVANDDPERFKKRYQFLVREHYDDWVGWRSRKIHAYHSRLAAELTKVRPGMKLLLDPPGSDVAAWREAGIDPALCATNPAIFLEAGRGYPDPANRNPEKAIESASKRDRFRSVEPLQAVARSQGDGTVTALSFGGNQEGPYAKGNELGFEDSRDNVVYPDATVYAAGSHYLQRFAAAMADGNITFMHDGTHGYVLGQPIYLRPFLAEYRALPPLGMKPLGDTDPAALWYGSAGQVGWFYLVNRAPYPVETVVTFSGKSEIERITTGENLTTADNKLAVTLQGYQLLAYRHDLGVQPTAIAITVPDSAQKEVKAQLAAAEQMLTREPADLQVVPLSPEDLLQAETQLKAVSAYLEKGQTWRARQTLLDSHLIRVYEAFHAYPPGLMNRKTFSLPVGAIPATDLWKQISIGGSQALVGSGPPFTVKPSSEIAPGLPEIDVLLLTSKPITANLDVPYTGKYRLQCAYVSTNDYAPPVISQSGKVLNVLGDQQGTLGGVVVTVPVTLQAGKQRIGLARGDNRQVGILGLYLEPVYRDLKAAEFLAIGPFPGFVGWTKGGGVVGKMDETYPPEDKIDLAGGLTFGGKKLAWVTPEEGIQSADSEAPNYICLYKTFGEMTIAGKGSISYASTELTSPEARAALLSLGADYWAKVWVNGEVVFSPKDRPKGPPLKGETKIPIQLKKGANEILVKLHAGSNGNGFWLSITDPGDLSVTIRDQK